MTLNQGGSAMGEGNGFVQLVAVDDLPEDLRAQHDAAVRPGLANFVRMMGNAPELFRSFTTLNTQVRSENHLGARTTELVRLAVANTTRCQVCLAGRAPAAIAEGLTEALIAEIGSESPQDMTAAEHAAVLFASKFATDHLSITESDKAALREHFDDRQVVELSLFVVLCLVGRLTMLVGLEDQVCPI